MLSDPLPWGPLFSSIEYSAGSDLGKTISPLSDIPVSLPELLSSSSSPVECVDRACAGESDCFLPWKKGWSY